MIDLWNSAAETMSDADIAEMQLAKLKTMVRRLETESPYYRAKFADVGVTSDSLVRLDDIRRFPYFDKLEERASQEASMESAGHPFGLHITCDPKLVNRVSSSSGTTGRPTFTGYTAHDRAWGHQNVGRMMRRIGVEQGEMVFHTMVLSMWIAGLPFAEGMIEYGACVAPTGVLAGTERWAQLAETLRPTTVIMTPSFGRHLLTVLPERFGLDPASLGIKRLVVTGEPGGSLPETYSLLEAGFGGATVYDLAGATGSHSPVAVSCEEHDGLHFFAHDSCYMEVIDPATLEVLPMEDGVEGEVVFTGIEKECAPMLRWREKDLVRVATRPCACGRPGPRLWIVGRSDDMLLVKGVNVFPSAVHEVVQSFVPRVTGAMRIVKVAPGPVVEPPMPLRVEVADGIEGAAANDLARDIEEAVHNRLRFRVKVRLESAGAVGLSYGKTHKLELVEKAYA